MGRDNVLWSAAGRSLLGTDIRYSRAVIPLTRKVNYRINQPHFNEGELLLEVFCLVPLPPCVSTLCRRQTWIIPSDYMTQGPPYINIQHHLGLPSERYRLASNEVAGYTGFFRMAGQHRTRKSMWCSGTLAIPRSHFRAYNHQTIQACTALFTKKGLIVTRNHHILPFTLSLCNFIFSLNYPWHNSQFSVRVLFCYNRGHTISGNTWHLFFYFPLPSMSLSL